MFLNEIGLINTADVFIPFATRTSIVIVVRGLLLSAVADRRVHRSAGKQLEAISPESLL